jgi:high affinity sulfate transporter 1
MVIPQSMSYATLAGLPVQYGLYSAVYPLYAYALYGSSRQLAVGPVAMVSLLFHTGLAKIMEAIKNSKEEDHHDGENDFAAAVAAAQSTATAIAATETTTSASTSTTSRDVNEALAVQTAALVGLCYLTMYTFRLGYLTQYLSHAVISGFTTGAAVLIALSQIKHFVGYAVDGNTLIEILWNVLRNIDQLNYYTLLYGTAFTAFLLLIKYCVKNKLPQLQPLQIAGPFLVTMVALLVPNHATRGSDENNDASSSFSLPVVGEIPRGLPGWTIHWWWPRDRESLNILVQFLPTIVSIVLVGFMESIAIAKQLAVRHGYEMDANAELYGLGMANLVGGAVHAYPVSGSFSRSAVNLHAHSPLSGVVTATTVAVTLLYWTPLVRWLPLCALAAIVLAGVLGVVDVAEAWHLYRSDQRDFAVWMTACLGVMLLGVEAGLVLSIAVSFLVLVPWRPFVHRMRRLTPDSTLYVDVVLGPESSDDNSSDVAVDDDVVILRISSSLHFANSHWVWSKVDHHVIEGTTRCIILEMTAVSTIDTGATNAVKKWIDECATRHIAVYLVGCSQYVKDRIDYVPTGEQGLTIVQKTVEDALLVYLQCADHRRGLLADPTA